MANCNGVTLCHASLFRHQTRFWRYNRETNELDDGIRDCTDEMARAVCRIKLFIKTKEMPQDKIGVRPGTGFIAKYRDCTGLLTNNHVISEEHLYGHNRIKIVFENLLDRQGLVDQEEFDIDPRKCISFTCAVMDVTFIMFDMGHSDEVLRSRRAILISLEELLQPPSMVSVIQRPENSENTKVSHGEYSEKYGFDFKHRASTRYGSSGSPVLLYQQSEVMGIHKPHH